MNLIDKYFLKRGMRKELKKYSSNYSIARKLIRSDFDFLKLRTEKERRFLFRHLTTYCNIVDKEAASSLYYQKKSLLKKIPDLDLEKDSSLLAPCYDEAGIIKLSIELSMMKKNPKILPLLDTNILQNFPVSMYHEFIEREKTPLRDAIKNLGEDQIQILTELCKNGFLKNFFSFSFSLSYSLEELKDMKTFLGSFKIQTGFYSIVYAEEFYCYFLNKVPCNHRKKLLSLFGKCNMDTFSFLNEAFIKEQNKDYVDVLNEIDQFCNIKEEDDVEIVKDVFSGRGNTQLAKNTWKILCSPSFLEGTSIWKRSLIKDIYENSKIYQEQELFDARYPFLTGKLIEDASFQEDKELQEEYLSYLKTEDLQILQERVKLFETPIFQQTRFPLNILKHIQNAPTIEIAKDYIRLLSLDGITQDAMFESILSRFQNVFDDRRADLFVGRVELNILKEEDETLRKNAFNLLPGDTKEVELEDGIILKIPDYSYVIKQADKSLEVKGTLQKKIGSR